VNAVPSKTGAPKVSLFRCPDLKSWGFTFQLAKPELLNDNGRYHSSACRAAMRCVPRFGSEDLDWIPFGRMTGHSEKAPVVVLTQKTWTINPVTAVHENHMSEVANAEIGPKGVLRSVPVTGTNRGCKVLSACFIAKVLKVLSAVSKSPSNHR
jgi:hypothetical protein